MSSTDSFIVLLLVFAMFYFSIKTTFFTLMTNVIFAFELAVEKTMLRLYCNELRVIIFVSTEVYRNVSRGPLSDWMNCGSGDCILPGHLH